MAHLISELVEQKSVTSHRSPQTSGDQRATAYVHGSSCEQDRG